MLEALGKSLLFFAPFAAAILLQLMLARFFPKIFARSCMLYRRSKGNRELKSRYEMHAFIGGFAIVFLFFIISRDGFVVELIFFPFLILIAALFELSEIIISWNSKEITQKRFLFRYRRVQWADISALNVNMPLDGFLFSDGKTRIEFKARVPIGEDGEIYEPTKDVASGVRAFARYARLKLREKPDVDWYAT